MAANPVEVSERMNARAEAIYNLISDLPRMGEWSPENTGGKWVKGEPAAVGSTFKGSNAKGFRRWSTTCTVTEAQPGRRFAFHVSSGPLAVSDWSYELTEDGDSTTVVERWVDRRPSWFAAVTAPIIGVADRAGHNRRNMEKTLSGLKQAAEAKPLAAG